MERIPQEAREKLEALSNKELARMFNEFASTTIKKFESHQAGVARFEKELEARSMELFIEDGNVKVRVSSTEVDEHEDGMDDGPEAGKAPEVSVETASQSPAPSAAELPPVTEEPAPRKVATPRNSQYMHKRITVVSEKNPKRAGSRAWVRFNLYTNEMTTEQYQEIVLNGSYGDRRDVLRDLWWDSMHGFIKLEDIAGAETAAAPAEVQSEIQQAA